MTTRPNIILITASEAGKHFGCYGVPSVSTPNIDRLAADGARFAHMYSSASINSTARVSLATGLVPQRHGMVQLVKKQWPCAMLDHRQHLSHILRAAGYRTALFGFQSEAHVMDDLGFDVRNRESLYDDDWQWGAEPDPRESYPVGPPAQAEVPAPQTAGDCAAYLDAARDSNQPFYAQVGFWETNAPYLWAGLAPDRENGVWFPPELELEETNKDGLEAQLANFQASLRRLDEGVGIILDALERNGLADDTIVIFTSDHGPELPRAKWSMYENGNHVAFILRWPGGGVDADTVHDALASHIDVVPTLSELAGFDVPYAPDGESFAALLHGEAWTRKQPAFGQNVYCRLYAARSQRYRFIRSFGGICFNKTTWKQNADVPAVELYDHANDPLETVNLANDPAHSDARTELDAALWRHLIANDDVILTAEGEGEAHERCRADLARYRQSLES